MGKALPLQHKFQPDSLGARAPQSFRSGIVAPGHSLLGGHVEQPAANDHYHPLRDGAAAVQEDAFWHDAYTREPYYVPGRGYDQYRPAYAMGWQAAFDFTASEFAQIEQELEHRWESHDTSSLLDWVQVRDAVYAAWMRARQCQAQVRNRALQSDDRQGVLLRPLYRLQLHTAHDLTLLLRRAEPPPTAFVRQVVDRHVAMLQEFAAELSPASLRVQDWADPLLRIGTSVHYGWTWLRSWVQDVNTERVLQLCDEREQQMLALYPAMLASTTLSPELSSLLHRQQHRLQLHHAKLQWVRLHWMQRG